MEGLIKLLNEWEIQLLVLFSFTLQLFLFFTGILRRGSSGRLLRFFIWIAFLGADLVAVYALGLLARQDQDNNISSNSSRGRIRSQPLGFFWAPFLLVHLGGQDTITAFSMEDNNLWLRHLLNLVVQVGLALYVFLKSVRMPGHSVWLLASGALVFVAGITKYGERTWCLKRGSLKGLEASTRVLTFSSRDLFNVDADGDYAMAVREALRSMPYVLSIFSTRGYSYTSFYPREDINQMVKMGRLQLGLVYDELYTKALVFRTKSAMVFRYISQISLVAAFVLFHAIVDKRTYAKVDVALTYSLFIGGFFIEVCSIMLNSMTSPRTWSMLKRRKWEKLAKVAWYIFSSDIGWSEKKQRWPSTIGQYNYLSWLTGSRSQGRLIARTTFSQRVMTVVTRVFVDFFGARKEKIFWLSKVLDTWSVEADEMTMEYVAKEIILLDHEPNGRPSREWPNLGPMLEMLNSLEQDFGEDVVVMHILTGLLLSKYSPPSNSDMTAAAKVEVEDFDGVVRVCWKLSNYMMYLLVAHPSMLPLTTTSTGLWEIIQSPLMVSQIAGKMDKYYLQPTKETVKEMVYMWTRILLYAAGKSRAEMHKAHLASEGGELITFAWLLMCFFDLGDSQSRRIRVIKIPDRYIVGTEVYAFNIIAG